MMAGEFGYFFFSPLFVAFNSSNSLFFPIPKCSVDGERYFECQPKHGSMVPIMSVEIGDFPPESNGHDDDEI